MSDRPELKPVLAAVDLLVPTFQKSGLDELEVGAGEMLIRLARPRSVAPSPTPAAATPAPVAQAPVGAALTPYGDPSPGMRFVTAPLTGVWYAAPSPGARAYVQVADEISAGQVVGLIEAMKLFNEIKSDVAGKVVRILVESGSLVKRQQPLLEIDPS